MQTEFPELEFVHLEGYKLQYGSSRLCTIFKIIFQIPKILIAINRENKWLKNYSKSKHLDIVIADNRYGFYHRSIISIFVTHQLLIKTSLGKFTDALVQQINYYFINRFNYCWVPDAAGDTNLAGALSHPVKLPKTPVLYTGVQSRITKEPTPVAPALLLLLSGPEPQRTILENILLLQLKQPGYNAVLVRGLPVAGDVLETIPGLTVFNHLPKSRLQYVINAAEVIVCRSGYSTIMDLLPLGKKCILIPTPGQAEQEYLADWLSHKNYACTALQHNFSLPVMMEEARRLQLPDLSALKNDGPMDAAIAALITILANNPSSP